MLAKYAVIPDKEKCVILTEEIDEKDVQSDELLVRTSYSMISPGTELAGFYALSPRVYQKGSWNAYPWRPGYGLCGEVLAQGSDITDFTVGDRIFCFGKHASLQKYQLDLRGNKHVSAAIKAMPELNDQTIAASHMGLVAITAPQVSGVELNDTVVIFGLGIVGNLTAQLYQLMGARVIGLDTIASRCERAKQVGIDEVICVEPEKQIQAVLDLTPGGEGAHITIDAVGHSAVVQTCVQCTRMNGKIILLGSPRVAVEGNLTDIFRPAHLKCLQILGAFEWRLPAYSGTGIRHSMTSNLALLWDLIASRKLKMMDLVSHVIQPQEMEGTYRGLMENKEEYFGALVDWTGA